jgi:hypothetical protein
MFWFGVVCFPIRTMDEVQQVWTEWVCSFSCFVSYFLEMPFTNGEGFGPSFSQCEIICCRGYRCLDYARHWPTVGNMYLNGLCVPSCFECEHLVLFCRGMLSARRYKAYWPSEMTIRNTNFHITTIDNNNVSIDSIKVQLVTSNLWTIKLFRHICSFPAVRWRCR